MKQQVKQRETQTFKLETSNIKDQKNAFFKSFYCFFVVYIEYVIKHQL